MLVGAAEYIEKYDYICFAHDKKVPQISRRITGYDFSEHCFENVLGSKEYVNNIITKFETEPYLGILCPPPPNHGDYYVTGGCEWGYNYEITKELYDDMELHIPISLAKEPIAPFGTMFWFRTEALKKLFAKRWRCEDFPKEPNKVDGTVLHGIERLYPFVAQDAGYFTAWCMTDSYAGTECTNLFFMVRNLNTRLFALYGVKSYNNLVGSLGNRLWTGMPQLSPRKKRVKDFFKGLTPKPIWAAMKKIYHFFGGKKWVG